MKTLIKIVMFTLITVVFLSHLFSMASHVFSWWDLLKLFVYFVLALIGVNFVFSLMFRRKTV